MKSSPHKLDFMKVRKATIQFHNGRQKYRLTKRFPIRASIATGNSSWQNDFPNWKSFDLWIQSARPEWCSPHKTKLRRCRGSLPCEIRTQKSAVTKSTGVGAGTSRASFPSREEWRGGDFRKPLRRARSPN